MANQEQLDILKQGVEHWNKWRRVHKDTRPDLSGTTLGEADFSGTNFSSAILSFATLSGAWLSRANLAHWQLPI